MSTEYKVISKVLGRAEINTILHGGLCWSKRVTSRRTLSATYQGAVSLYEKTGELQYYRWVQLPDGRVDINLPTVLADRLISQCQQKRILEELGDPELRVVHINLLITPPYAATQQWHQDNGGLSPDAYYTLLIPLNRHPLFGQTELVVPYRAVLPKAPKSISPNLKLGDGLLFSGSLWHRGTYNGASVPRYCLYLIISKAPSERLFESWT